MHSQSDLSSKSLRDLFSLRDRLERRVHSLRSALAVEASLRGDGHRRKPSNGEHPPLPGSGASGGNLMSISSNNASETDMASGGGGPSNEMKDMIFAAVLTEDPEYLHRLLSDRRGDPNCRDFKGRTPLHLACFTGDLACVELLVEFGAEVNAVDDKEQTPREVALFHNNMSVVAFLDPGKVGADTTSSSSSSSSDDDDDAGGGGGENDGKASGASLTEAILDFGVSAELSSVTVPLVSLPLQQKLGILPSLLNSPALRPAVGGVGDGTTSSSSTGGPTLSGPLLSMGESTPATAKPTPLHQQGGKDKSILDRRMQPSLFVTVGDTESIVVCMVGLPGRGKSFLSKNCSRFLRWKGVPAEVFNAGDYRRRILGVEGTHNAAWFDSNNAKAKEQREQMAHMACEDAAVFLRAHPVAVAFIDATNTNRVRRQWLIDFFTGIDGGMVSQSHILFIESVCDDDEVITQNILRDKVTNGDYSDVPVQNVVSDFRSRIDKYREQYEPLDSAAGPDERLSFLKVINLKRTLVANRLTGRLQTLTASLITNLYPVASSLYLVIPRGEQTRDEEQALLSTRLVSSTEDLDEMAPALAAFLRQRCARLAEMGQRFHLAYAGPAVDPSSERAVASLMRAFAEDVDAAAVHPPSSFPSSAASPTATAAEPPQNLSLVSLENLQPMKFGLCDGSTIAGARREYPRVMDSVYVPQCSEPVRARKELSGPAALESLTLQHIQHQENKARLAAMAAANGGTSNSTSSSLLKFPSSTVPSPESVSKLGGPQSATTTPTPKTQKVTVPSAQQLARTYFTSYPKGESLRQVAVRTWTLINEWKRCQGPLMYFCPEAQANLLLAFAVDLPPEAASQLRLPRCTIIEITAKHACVIRSLLGDPEGNATSAGSWAAKSGSSE